MTNFPNIARRTPLSMSIDTDKDGVPDRAFIEMGVSINGHEQDMYEYLPKSNTWVRVVDHVSGRASAIEGAYHNKGYVGLGFDGVEEQSDIWTHLPDLPSSPVTSLYSFVINNVVYVLGGHSKNVLQKDFWSYLPSRSSYCNGQVKETLYIHVDSLCID